MRAAPPLSPFLLVGRLIPPVSYRVADRVLERVLNVAVSAVWTERPVIGDRLQALGPVTYRINPVDLPLSLFLYIGEGAPRLCVTRREDEAEATAVISGPVTDLMAMLSGDADGDALFFSRTITIEGGTDAVVALRNALDDAGVDLIADVTARLGPLGGPVRSVLHHVDGLSRRFGDDLAALADAVRGPVSRRVDAYGHVLDEVEGRLDKLERAQSRRKPG